MRVRRNRPRTQRSAVACLAAVVVLGLGGCTLFSEYVENGFKVGPNYARPCIPAPTHWIDEADPRVAVGCPNLTTWWDVFGDPVLDELIRRAYSCNPTLRAHAYQILAAEEQRRIARTLVLPQSQTGSFAYTHTMISNTGGSAVGPAGFFGTGLAPSSTPPPVSVPSTPVAGMVDPGPGTTTTGTNAGGISTTGAPNVGGIGGRTFDNWATNANLAWELDVWGLYRRNIEAATAALDQSVLNSDETAVLVLAGVAEKYVEIRTLQRRLQLARRNVAQQEPLVAQYERRYRTGIANAQPGYAQLRSNLENTRALIPALEITLRETNNALCSLLGIPMEDLQRIIGDGTVVDPARPNVREVRIPRPGDYSVVVGIPGDVLFQRPDIRAAEQQLKIQSAQIGISEAEMLPHFGVNGSIGVASNRLNHLFTTQSGTGTIGPSLSWNILNYGRLLRNLNVQNDVYQQFVAEYQQALLNANQDAENALTAYLRSMEQAEYLRESAKSATELTDYLLRSFREGYFPPGTGVDTGAFINQIFTATNFQVTQQDAAAQVEGSIAVNLILLYRAMGGGWQLRLNGGRPGMGECGELCLPEQVSVPPPPFAAVQQDGKNQQDGKKRGPAGSDEPSLLPEPITVSRPGRSGKDGNN
jgi:NodT family efflux transporter outer membrane factor (OMF) lipoprotein